MALKLSNFATTKLTAPASSTATSLSIQTADAAKFPTLSGGDWFPIVAVNSLGDREVMYCTARAGALLTVTRAQEGTTALDLLANDRIDLRVTAGVFYALDELYDLGALMLKTGATMTGPLTLNADPSSAMHATTKQYTDALGATKANASTTYSKTEVDTLVANVAAGVSKRAKTRVKTTANVNLAGGGIAAGVTIDGVALVTGDIVFVSAQTAPAENGVYVVPATGAASRAAEFDTYDEIAGSLLVVMEGTVGADTMWLCTSNAGGTLGTTALVFSQVRIVSPGSTTQQGILELATAAEYRTGTDPDRALSVKETWDATLPVTVAYGATITLDMAAGLNFTTTLTGNATFANPSNTGKAQSGFIEVKQDATGGRVPSFGTAWKWAYGVVPSFSSAANTRDLIFYQVLRSGEVYASVAKAVA